MCVCVCVCICHIIYIYNVQYQFIYYIIIYNTHTLYTVYIHIIIHLHGITAQVVSSQELDHFHVQFTAPRRFQGPKVHSTEHSTCGCSKRLEKIKVTKVTKLGICNLVCKKVQEGQFHAQAHSSRSTSQ